MVVVSTKEIEDISIDYVYFKNIVDNTKSKQIKYAFDLFQNKCMKKLESLVLSKIYKYKHFSNYLDLKQDGFEALLAALDTFKPDKGQFIWWANRYIKTKISRSANAHSTIRYPIHKAKKNTPYKVSSIPTIIDNSLSPLDIAQISDYGKHINKAIDILPSKHKEVLNMTFGFNNVKPRSVNDIIEALDISRSNYIKIMKDIKLEVKNYFKKLERI